MRFLTLPIAIIIFSMSCNSKFIQKENIDVNWIITNHIKAMGGEKSLEEIKTFYTLFQSNETTVESFIELGSNYRQEFFGSEHQVSILWTEQQMQKCINGEISELTEGEKLDYEEDSHVFRLLHADRRGWRFALRDSDDTESYYLTGINLQNQMELIYLVDRNSFLLNGLIDEKRGIVKYWDYEKVSTFQYPTKFSLNLENSSTTYILKKIITDIEFDVNTFNEREFCK